jgi:hypothetical protein
MSEISIYDIETASWHLQTASGAPNNETMVPADRWDGCSVLAPSPDNSSYNIYIAHGQSPTGGNSYDDVWVLLIPSFTWVKLYELAGTKGSCVTVGQLD